MKNLYFSITWYVYKQQNGIIIKKRCSSIGRFIKYDETKSLLNPHMPNFVNIISQIIKNIDDSGIDNATILKFL